MKSQKIKNIIPYFIFAAFCAIILTKPFGNGDELWNYSFAKNIVNGLVPYRDFNIVQTPLSAYIPALFMTILGDGLFIHRIVGFLLLFGITALVYRLCKKVTKSAFIGLISALFIACAILPFYVYNYNYLSALIVLIILDLEVSYHKEKLTPNIIVGLLVGISLLIKQNTGAMLVIANFIICVINIVRFKMNKKAQILRAAVSAIPMFLFIIYMLLVGALDDFFEYAVIGITTFVHRTTPLELISEAPFFAIHILFVIFAFVHMINHMRKDGISSNKISGCLFAGGWLMVAYPLFDAFHLVCVFIVLVPAFCMFITQHAYKKWEKGVCLIVVILISGLSVLAFLPVNENYVFSELNNYENIPIDAEADENIRTICEYIEDKKQQGYCVRITDDSAIAYKIPIDDYEKNWDMLLVGNVGLNSVENLLESPEKCIYLVFKHTEKLGGQNHFEVIEYIKDNYVKVDEVQVFDVYEKS